VCGTYANALSANKIMLTATWSQTSYYTINYGRLHLKCDGTRAETRFGLSATWTSSFKSVGASVQLTTGSQGVRMRGSNAGYTMFQGSVKDTVYLLHLPVSPSLPLPCVTMCHQVSTRLNTMCFCECKGQFSRDQSY